MMTRKIEVSKDLYERLEEMLEERGLHKFENLLWILIGQSIPIISPPIPEEPIKPTPPLEEIPKEPEDVPEYIKKYTIQLKNPNSQPSKIRRYIEKEGVITRGDLKRACVEHLGFKSEHGGIGATVKALETIGYIEIDGKGNRKRIKSLNPEISTNR